MIRRTHREANDALLDAEVSGPSKVGKPKKPASNEPQYDGKPRLVLALNGFEAWARWDNESGVFELFMSEACDDYIGCADSYCDARIVARQCLEAANA